MREVVQAGEAQVEASYDGNLVGSKLFVGCLQLVQAGRQAGASRDDVNCSMAEGAFV